KLKDKINQLASKDTVKLSNLTINNETHEIKEWEKNERLGEEIKLIKDLQQDHNYKYKIKLNRCNSIENTYFFDQLLMHLKESTIEKSINDLLTHSQARKYPDIYDINEEELKKRAEEILTLEFYNRGEVK